MAKRIIEVLPFLPEFQTPNENGVKTVTLRCGQECEGYDGINRFVSPQYGNEPPCTTRDKRLIIIGEKAPPGEQYTKLPHYPGIESVPLYMVMGDGGRTHADMLAALKTYYPEITDYSEIYPIAYTTVGRAVGYMQAFLNPPEEAFKDPFVRPLLFPSVARTWLETQRGCLTKEKRVMVSRYAEFMEEQGLISSKEAKELQTKMEDLRKNRKFSRNGDWRFMNWLLKEYFASPDFPSGGPVFRQVICFEQTRPEEPSLGERLGLKKPRAPRRSLLTTRPSPGTCF